jgi:prepilin-type processing-associated H-X9-DG protein
VVTWLLPTNKPAWDLGLHRYINKAAGNVALADGSVQRLSQTGLSRQSVAAAMDTHANCVLKDGT